MATAVNEIRTYFGRCRCCLEYGYLKNMWTVHNWEGDSEVYGEMLTQCFAFTLEKPECVDQDQICETCITRLRDAYNFKFLVIKSQRLLMKEGVSEGDMLKIKVENVKSEKSIDGDSNSANETQDGSDKEIEIDMAEIEKLEEVEVMLKEDADYEDVEYLEEEIVPGRSKGDSADSKPVSDTEESGPSKSKWPKKLPRSERNKRYLQYTEEDLRRSIEAVKTAKMSKMEAAEFFNVPRKTLAAKLKNEAENVPDAKKTENASVDVKEAKCATDSTKMKSKQTRSCTKKKKNNNEPKDEKEESAALQEMKKHKDNINSILLFSNATMMKSQVGGYYTCCFCNEKYPSPAELKRHNLDAHEDAHSKAIHVKYVSDLIIKLDVTGLRCIICGTKIDSLELLMKHLREHKKTIHMDIKNHIIPFKFESDALECVVCSKQYRFFKTLSEHMNEHYNNYECVTCGRCFINKQSMQTHSYRHQKNVGVFTCPQCEKVFDTRHKRSAHVRKIHIKGSKTRKCHVCNETFSSYPQVQSHMVKAHGAKPVEFRCDACDKCYSNGGTLSMHKKRFHLMLRPHKCTECEMAFFSRVELNTHMVTHTKTKEFQCDICDKRFGTKCCLYQHMRLHFGIKRYRCDWCDLKFAARSKMRIHMWKKHREVV